MTLLARIAATEELAGKASGGTWRPVDARGLGAPADCIDFAVVSSSTNRETARVWTEDDTHFIANLDPSFVLALCAAAKRTEELEWQDISTAPRDGRAVDLFGTRNGEHRRFCQAAWLKKGAWGTGDPTGVFEWIFPSRDLYSVFEFTHWRPLPTPPGSSQ